MSPDVLLILLLRTGAVLASALVVGRLARRAPALRVAVYRLGLLGAVVLALSSPWSLPQARPPIPVVLPPFTTVVSRTPAPSVPPSPLAAAVPTTLDPLALILPIWAVGSALLALRLAIGLAALARLRRRSRSVASDGLPAFESPAVATPFVAGVLRPAVYLPDAWEVAPDVRAAVLRHEAAHVANGDLRWRLLRRLVEVALWPQPLVWLLARPSALAEEELCDRRVLAGGMEPSRYAKGLLALRPGRCPALAIGAASSRSTLGRRVEAILDARPRAARLSRGGAILVRLGALALVATAAWAFARPVAEVPTLQKPAQAAPLASRVRLRVANGGLLGEARAWLRVNDGSPTQSLRVEGDEVVLPKGLVPPDDTSGTLAVHVKGRGLAFVRLWPSPKPVDALTVPGAVTLSGRLVTLDGKPASGTRVRPTILVRSEPDGSPSAFLVASEVPDLDVTATTDADGRFTLGDLPAGVQLGYDADDPRYAQSRMDARVELKVGERNVAKDLVLRPAARLTGRVTQGGAPVAGLHVGAQGQNDSVMDGFSNAVTDAEGRFALERLPAGRYNVIVDLRPPLSDGFAAAAREGVEARAGVTTSGLDLVVAPGGVVEGRVTDAAGHPAPLLAIGIYGPAHPQSGAWVQTAKVGKDGRYRAHVPPGEQYLYSYDSAWRVEPRRVRVVDGETVRVDFRAAPKPPGDPS